MMIFKYLYTVDLDSPHTRADSPFGGIGAFFLDISPAFHYNRKSAVFSVCSHALHNDWLSFTIEIIRKEGLPMKTPITWQSIRNHLTYSWWKYALLAVLAIFGWNLIYTVTEYKPPAHKKIDMFVFGNGDQERLDTYMEHVRLTEMSDMEAMSGVFLVVDETYTPMQLMTYIAAGEGHLYMLPREYFQNYASQDAFLPLENIPGLVEKLEAAGVSLDRGWRTSNETGEKHLYGIPMAKCAGFNQYAFGFEESFLSIPVTNGNDENSMKFLQIFLEDMLDPNHQMPALPTEQ